MKIVELGDFVELEDELIVDEDNAQNGAARFSSQSLDRQAQLSVFRPGISKTNVNFIVQAIRIHPKAAILSNTLNRVRRDNTTYTIFGNPRGIGTGVAN